MENLQVKLELLSQIAKELNDRNVTWAIGASMLLYFKGIITEFHDIDIMVSEEDFELVQDVLNTFGKQQAPNPNSKYKTKYFGEFVVDDIDIDVIAGFIIVDGDREHYFPLVHEDIADFTEISGVKVPLQSLEEWRSYYQLMGRVEKVKLIDAWL